MNDLNSSLGGWNRSNNLNVSLDMLRSSTSQLARRFQSYDNEDLVHLSVLFEKKAFCGFNLRFFNFCFSNLLTSLFVRQAFICKRQKYHQMRGELGFDTIMF